MMWQTVVFIFLMMTCKILAPNGSPLFQEDINSFFNWCHLNGLQCKAVNFGGHEESAQFLLGSEYIHFNKRIEDLGFTVSSTLSWKAHQDLKFLNCNRIVNFLKRSIPFPVSCHRKILLYRALILPLFIRCSCLVSVLNYATSI